MTFASLSAGACVLLAALLASAVQAQTSPPAKPQQFVYVLRVAPAWQDSARWTQRENDAVGRHFARLAKATEARQVIFAGRTDEPLPATFGLVVFEADDEAAARRFMDGDPAVEAGLMTATLHRYVLALQRKP